MWTSFWSLFVASEAALPPGELVGEVMVVPLIVLAGTRIAPTSAGEGR